jgi:hypothetical protein
MTKDAEVWLVFLEERSSVLRELPAFIQHMTDGDAVACQFDHDLGRKSALFIIVDVALARIIPEVSAASADTRL